MKKTFLARSLLAAALLAAGAAWAAAPSQAQIERLTDLVVQTMPFGQVFDKVQSGDPNWPLGEKAAQAGNGQLACLRSELSSAGYRRTKRKDVVAYAQAHPEDVANDIRLLEAGAAELFGKLITAGIEAESSGKAADADADALLATATAAQGISLTSLATDANHAALRELIGMGSMFDQLAAEGEDDHAKEKGEKQGAQLGVQLMIGAMQTCDVPLSALQ